MGDNTTATIINTKKISELNTTMSINDDDVFVKVKDDNSETNKVKFSNLINYIKNHSAISSFFVHQSSRNTANGVAPLDSNAKIPSDNITFGKSDGTVYEGRSGATLEAMVSNHISNVKNPHNISKIQIGLDNVDNTSDVNKPISTAQQTAIDLALNYANTYADTIVSNLINGAPETGNTLKELNDLISDNKSIIDTLNAAIGNKASKAELDSHVDNPNIHFNTSERNSLNSAKEHASSAHAPSNAEKNIIIGIQKNGTDISANSATRKVNIVVPTKLSEMENDVGFTGDGDVIVIDTALSPTSTNPIQNKAVNIALSEKSNISHSHPYAGSSSIGGAATTALVCTGNSATATRIETSRTINGTLFNGTANITTNTWGTSRTIKVGNKSQIVNGSANVTYTLDDIGAMENRHEISSKNEPNSSSQSIGDYWIKEY